MPGPPERTTPRLLLRAPREQDVDDLFAIQGDRKAMSFTYCAPRREDTARHLASHAARYVLDGFAPWTVRLRSDLRVIGWGGLFCDPEAPHWGAEVGYYLQRECWGRGLASELVATSLEHAFEDLGLLEVGAFARPENGASVRVLEKAGFRRMGYVPELERDRFRLEAGAWRSRVAPERCG